MFAALLTLVALALPAGELSLGGVKATRIPWVGDGLRMAAADASALNAASPGSGQFCFYVFVPRPSREAVAAYTYAFNCAPSYASTPLAPDVLHGGHLLRFDLKRWCPDEASLKLVAGVLAQHDDRYLYVKGQVLEAVAPYKASDGKTYTTKLVKLPVFGPHTDGEAAVALKEQTSLVVPLVYGPRWIGQSLRTLEGGLYYKLRGYDKLDQKQWLATFGADEAASEALRGNAYAGRLLSGVTAKPRRGVAFFGTAVRPTYGFPLVTLTQDLADGEHNPDEHPIYSLLDFKFAATELIAPLPNSFPAAFLANAKGERQDVVPPNIARDHTIPSPYTANLEPLLSCGRCHGPDDMLKPFPNDVSRLLGLERADGKKLDIFGDLSRPDQRAAVDELSGKYGGNLEDAFILARNAHERACFRVTGMGVSECWDAISEEWRQHYYEPLTARRASLELGWLIDEAATDEQCAKFFRELVPVVPPNEYGVSSEDPVIASLCDYLRGGEVSSARLLLARGDWERVYRDAALRAQAGVAARMAADKAKE